MADVLDPAAYPFGRVIAEDPRDRQYPFSLALPTEWPRRIRRRFWTPGPIVDQRFGPPGLRNSCVGHGCRQFLSSTPKPRTDGPDGFALYDQARRYDPWPENDRQDMGTTVRAGFEVLRNHGYVATYLWAWRVDEIAKWLLRSGPVVLGTQWFEGMMAVDARGFLQVQGQVLGGHCVTLIGVDRESEFVEGVNSWGTGWGRTGRFRLSWRHLSVLLEDGAECCVAVERPLRPRG